MKICKETQKQFYFFFCLLFLILNFYWIVCFTWNLFFCCEFSVVIKFLRGCRYFENWYKNAKLWEEEWDKKIYVFFLFPLYIIFFTVVYRTIDQVLYVVNFLRIWFQIKSNICKASCIGFQKSIRNYKILHRYCFFSNLRYNLIGRKTNRSLFYL